MDRFRVVTTGALRVDTTPQEALRSLAVTFKTSPERLRPLLSGQRVVVKRDVDESTARAFHDALDRAGVLCELEIEPAGAPPVAATISTPSQRRVCPACGYRPSTPDDPLLVAHGGRGECPSCGVIPAKLEQKQGAGSTAALVTPLTPPPAEPAAPAPTTLETPVANATAGVAENPSPSLHERLLAHVITNCHVAIPAAIGHLIAVLLVTASYGDRFVVTTSNAFFTSIEVNAAAQSLIAGLSLLVALAVLAYEYVLLPATNGATRGELARGIVIIDDEGREARSTTLFARRLAGVTVCDLFWLASFLPVAHPRKKSLADLLSRSRPVVAGAPSSGGWRVFALAIVVVAATQWLSMWRLQSMLPESADAKAARLREAHEQAKAMDAFARMAAGMLDGSESALRADVEAMLELYRRDHDAYTDDIETLVRDYGRRVAGPRTPFLMQAADEGRISIELGDGPPKVHVSEAPAGPKTRGVGADDL